MDKNVVKVVPKRRRTRLKGFDYSTNGMYFVTICVQDRKCILGKIVGQGLAPAEMILSEYGEIAQRNILSLEQRFKQIKIENYVVMPNHIHILIFIDRFDNGRIISAPTLSVIIGQMKRWISRQTGKTLFQKSFHDHIIRGEQDYKLIYNYIESNPSKWTEDCFYAE